MMKHNGARNMLLDRLPFRPFHILLSFLVLVVWMSGCSPTRYMPDDRYYLKKDIGIKGNRAVSSGELFEATRTRTNRRMLSGPKVFLYIYNVGMSIANNDSKIKEFLMKRESVKTYYYPNLIRLLTKEVGEAPTLLDLETIKKDSANLRNLYFGKGYFHPDIHYEIDTVDNFFVFQKSKVKFIIQENSPTAIGVMKFNIEDEEVKQIFMRNVEDCLLSFGKNYDHTTIDAERRRIVELMRENGYYNFPTSSITFTIDTLQKISMPLAPSQKVVPRYLTMTLNIEGHPIQYRIREVRDSIVAASSTQEDLFAIFRPDSLTAEIVHDLELPEKLSRDSDLHITFRVSRSLLNEINFDFIGRKIKLKEGALYRRKDAVATQRSLQSLSMFQYVTITYKPIDSLRVMDVKITNKLASRYQLKTGAETFTDITSDNSNNYSSFNLNLGLNASLRNRNTFFHSELSELSSSFFVGLYRAILPPDSGLIKVLYEIRPKFTIDFPRLITPFPSFNRRDLTAFMPKTSISLAFRFESRREYQRITFGTNFAYRWNHLENNSLASSTLTPLALDVISVPEQFMNPEFKARLAQPEFAQLQRDFLPRFGSRITYTFLHSDYMSTRRFVTHYLRATLEEGGTLPYVIDRLTQGEKLDSSYQDHTLFNKKNPIEYGRFIKLSAEGKLYIPLWKTSEIVGRMAMGASYRFPFTDAMPLQNRFFLGGTNGMRGWRSSLLGPGTSDIASENVGLPPGGDYMFESNIEWRFKFWSYINMALFSDIGNVWFATNDFTKKEYKPGAILSRENLKLGWDAGIGFRLDFSFLIIRLDLAEQLYLPQYQDYLWKLNSTYRKESFNLNIGIGYPF